MNKPKYQEFDEQMDEYGAQKSKPAQKPKKQMHPDFQQFPSSQQQIETKGNYNLNQSAHPLACIFTFLFKALAFLVYFLIGNFFSDVFTFILVTILSGVDFWVVKNVTGRLLVGLRWWSDFTEDGKEIWIYESFDTEVKLNPVDAAFFWTSQLGAVLTWLVFLAIKIIGFSLFWGILVMINLVLALTNLYGFYKCRGEHSKKLKGLQDKYAKQGIMHFASKMI